MSLWHAIDRQWWHTVKKSKGFFKKKIRYLREVFYCISVDFYLGGGHVVEGQPGQVTSHDMVAAALPLPLLRL
jgi:hypothetical protein